MLFSAAHTLNFPLIFKGLNMFCNASWDGVSCWPTTPAGSLVSVPCFAELNGVKYDTSSNASRFCQENGTWSPWSNYRSCKPLRIQEDEFLQVLWDMKEAATIYYVGYGISLIALTFALFIFFRFKELKCLRNTIHTNLMVTYLLIDITWILTATLQSHQNPTTAKMACFLVILLTYLMATNFFWMLVEGLYLYMQVVKTFSTDSVKFKTYVVIGWGIPAIVAAAWAVVKGVAGGSPDEPFAQRGCPWQNKDYYDYVFSCPVMLVLLINIFFLAKIMWVLITKLRVSSTAESRQYRKAAKALLVLIPLLGVTYIVVIATPSEPVAEVVFIYIQATLLSMQGFMVAVLYCFLNAEVQNSVKHYLETWRTQKSISKAQRQSIRKSSQINRKSIVVYRSKSAGDSCVSFASTTEASGISIPNLPSRAKRICSLDLARNREDVL
ncbi:diuretic hormone receptor-like isoform X2 [Stegodyphus dumicola]|uniref:diuretic hormone receptor-like isoform X2 n=1 Tax=Stegodyphus dumicola TaxID=202533 RepID=UPI0015AB1479|nr:diuretic hormone receptor-like isoform X2 [Stegodyphus dumicola]